MTACNPEFAKIVFKDDPIALEDFEILYERFGEMTSASAINAATMAEFDMKMFNKLTYQARFYKLRMNMFLEYAILIEQLETAKVTQ